MPTSRPVVYTAITAGYDHLLPPPHAAANAADFVAFLEEPCESPIWRSYPIHRGFADPTRNAKIHKILPHRFLPEAEYSLWIDGSVTIIQPAPLQALIDTCLADCDIAVFEHRLRTCVYQEASVCLERRLDDPEVIWQQMCRYTAAAYPANAGLGECCVILRRHSAAVRALNEAWWDEIVRGSRRDQLSFDYAARLVGVRYATFPGTIAVNPWFRRRPHLRERPPHGGAQIAGDGADAPPAAAGRYFSGPARRSRRRKRIAFGAMRTAPSWHWTGFEVARELSRDYDVALYERGADPPPCDVVFQIKQPPSAAFVDGVRRRGSALVYCPIDAYDGPERIADHAPLLGACAMVLVHSERLLAYLRPYCRATRFVEHHTRYALDELVPYRADGFVLWIGQLPFVPYLLHWLAAHPLDRELRILTDLQNERGWILARPIAADLGVTLDLADGRVGGHRALQWSERRQRELMRDCKAALDVKHTVVFSQRHKPPTKAQQFVASGIPCALNPESYSAEYFRRRGFDPASPADPDRWLSRDYWETTRQVAARLRRDTSLDAVAAQYRELIESL